MDMESVLQKILPQCMGSRENDSVLQYLGQAKSLNFEEGISLWKLDKDGKFTVKAAY